MLTIRNSNLISVQSWTYLGIHQLAKLVRILLDPNHFLTRVPGSYTCSMIYIEKSDFRK